MSRRRIASLYPFLIITLSLTAYACSRTPGGGQTPPAVVSISPRETEGLLRNEFAVLVDVREPDELKDGMAASARNIPTSKIVAGAPEWKEFLEKTSKDKQLIFYDDSGRRASRAATEAAQQGFRAANLGAFKDWVAAGLPVRKP